MNCLVAVIGPTAAGKSQLALELGQNFRGEIVNADSRQVYRYMDIGTAKPSRGELSLVRHHLIDLIYPDQSFSLALYQRLANEAIEDIQHRKKLPILVGGSGLYIWCVLEGWKIPAVPPNTEFRRAMEKEAWGKGSYELFQELQKIDPAAASKIMPGNLRRIIRALEVYRGTGRPVSEQWQKQPPTYPVLIIGLTMRREHLYRRIDSRVDEMIAKGLVDEVKYLMGGGYCTDLPSMSGIGYKQIAMFLRGEIDLTRAVAQIKIETHRLARRQYTWFKLEDSRIHWLNENNDPIKEAHSLTEVFLGSIPEQAGQS
jgi:tRNA dimethylallyltransferase